MYKILVHAKIVNFVEIGYFSGCYRAVHNGEKGTFISYSNGNDINKDNIKTFKTLSQAKSKLKFLQQKIEENGYMWDWELEIIKEDQ